MSENKAGAVLPIEAKAVGDAGEFEGYASTYGVDQGRDRVVPGAFAESLRIRGAARVKMLRDHDPRQLIGVWTAAAEDGRGLHVKGRVILETQAGREAHALMKAGALDSLSIGYRTVRHRMDRKSGERLLEAVDLREISLTGFPMNEAATVSHVKHTLNDPAQARRLVQALDRATAALGRN
ncbi:HK97 family phage prohead protease [Methylobacterium sp. GC_Met_2]|uniref:HK97 family phage prohead protease n=1 Tax=Methylobacterium sp. GC_Met_2 TaxID=2937376 RepID=UPI00226BA04D|nr:HK97 family phage prohead protease [Methylobacterium sp. GC_Met_2]